MDLAVTCQPKAQPGATLDGRTGNISRSGLQLRLPQDLSPGTLLEITLHAPNGPLRVEGSIVWVDPPERRKSGQSIRHGVQFTSSTWSISHALGLVMADRTLR